jgi:outer membrane PBP1 activator LpoA protein
MNEIQNNISKAEDGNFINVENTEVETPETELMEYKKDFFDMSVGSLKAIMTHAKNILSSLENPSVAENLTESWLQGKIAITEDYMRTIHDFIMYVSEAADNLSAADKQGLWDNIRKKREREGKKYKPAKRGDPDRPDPQMWKKLTKDSKDSKK